MKEIGIGLLGFGLVGSGVVKALHEKNSLIKSRTGLNLVLRGIADLDLSRDRKVHVEKKLLTSDAESVINNPDVNIVIELIGGSGIANELIMKALRLKKPVVTANKALLAEHGEELFRLASENQTDIFFEASVGAGIPLIRSLREGLVSNRIRSIHGILNGTCNYILTRMEEAGLSFESALHEAQRAGYAEADPSLDIDGIDSAHKAVILASLAYGFHVPLSSVIREGIRELEGKDIQYAFDLGYRIKMLTIIKEVGYEIEIGVHPTLVPLQHIMASVSRVFNAVFIDGDEVGDVLYYGRGAGREPTASAVISDVVDAARKLVAAPAGHVPSLIYYNQTGKIRESGESNVRCYLRLTLLDRPGVLGQITTILGKHNISIASVLQKEACADKQVPVIIITHQAQEKAFRAALKEIDSIPIVGARTVRLRIEDF